LRCKNAFELILLASSTALVLISVGIFIFLRFDPDASIATGAALTATVYAAGSCALALMVRWLHPPFSVFALLGAVIAFLMARAVHPLTFIELW
jgi:uncharacterized BrkB/YihY/UPF0761 family membrane protein